MIAQSAPTKRFESRLYFFCAGASVALVEAASRRLHSEKWRDAASTCASRPRVFITLEIADHPAFLRSVLTSARASSIWSKCNDRRAAVGVPSGMTKAYPPAWRRLQGNRMSLFSPSPCTQGDLRLSEAKSRLVGSWGEGSSYFAATCDCFGAGSNGSRMNLHRRTKPMRIRSYGFFARNPANTHGGFRCPTLNCSRRISCRPRE